MLEYFMYYKGPIDMSDLSFEALGAGRYAQSNIADEEKEYLVELSREFNDDSSKAPSDCVWLGIQHDDKVLSLHSC
jgi:hypothetical protein